MLLGSTMRLTPAALLPLLLASTGCFPGAGPSAARIGPDGNDRYYPQREIQFVEHGRRCTGVLISASAGYANSFQADYKTLLVPTPPSPLDGFVWTGPAVSKEQAIALHALPPYRDAIVVTQLGDLARFNLRQPAVWVLGTDPFILGVVDGQPLHPWPVFAAAATGDRKPVGMAVPPFRTRYAVREELDQPLHQLWIFPADFWAHNDDVKDVVLTVVTLPKPLSVDQTLDALAKTDARSLGMVETRPLYDPSESPQDRNHRLGDDYHADEVPLPGRP